LKALSKALNARFWNEKDPRDLLPSSKIPLLFEGSIFIMIEHLLGGCGSMMYFGKAFGCAITGLLLFPVASLSSPKKPTRIQFWNIFTAAGPKEAIVQLVEEFNRTHADIYVERLDVGRMEEKFLASVAGGVPPDVALFDRFKLAAYGARGALRPLNDLIKRDSIRAEDFFKATWEECLYQGQMFGMPFNTDVRVLFYNKDLFREAGLDPKRPPRTWEELVAYSDRLTRRDASGRIIQTGFVPLPGWGNTWLYLYGWQKGGHFMSADGSRVTCDDPRIVEALEWVVAFVDRYNYRDLEAFRSGFGAATEMHPFLRGKMAMTGDEGFLMSIIKRYNPSLNYGVAPLPYPKDGVRATWSGGFALVIPTGARHVEEAWTFIKWMTQPGPQLLYGQISEQMPANIHAANDSAFLSQGYWKLFVEEMAYSRFRPVTPVGEVLWDELVRAMEFAALHKGNPREILQAARQKVQKELDQLLIREKRPVVNGRKILIIFSLVFGLLLLAKAFHSTRYIRKLHLQRREAIQGYLFIAPWLIGFLVFTLGPVVATVIFSLSDYQILQPARWIGWENYQELLTKDPIFWKSLYNTFYYMLGSVPLGLAIALGLALLVQGSIKGVSVFRTAFYLPTIVPIVASAILWLWILNPEFGLLNALLAKLGIRGPLWLASEQWSKPSLILMSLWGVGGTMIIYIAGLESIPRDLYEAAQLDGANGWQQFRHITLPMLSPAIFFTLIIGIITAIQVFTQVYVMTFRDYVYGGPADSTLFYVLYLFRNAFGYLKMGYASAMAWILFWVILALTLIQFRLARRWVFYAGEER